jgi:hypothetical protein
MPNRSLESLPTLQNDGSHDNKSDRTTRNRLYQAKPPSFESFYLLHDDFDPQSTDGTRKRVCSTLVRSIERWLSQFHALEPIDRKYIHDRGSVSQHFTRWCLQIERLPSPDDNLQRSIAALPDPLDAQAILLEHFCEHLFKALRSNPNSPIVQRHWTAFYMQRCVVVGWRTWRKLPFELQSLHLFREIVTFGHCRMPRFHESKGFLGKFEPDKSELVSGINHVKAYINGQIENSILPDLRKILGDPYYPYSDLGVAARCSKINITKALKNINRSDADIDEYEILWKCFQIYKQETGIAANLLKDDDFQEIEQIYRSRSNRAIAFLTGTNTKTQIEYIGREVHQFMRQPPAYLDKPINGSQSLADITPDPCQNIAEYRIVKEQFKAINDEIELVLSETHLPNGKRSYCKQLFWLRYGLDIKLVNIGIVLEDNHGLDPNPGSISRLLSNRHRYLFDRIHTTVTNRVPSISSKKINAAMGELLTHYFDITISKYVIEAAARLDLDEHNQYLSISKEHQLIEMLTNCFQQQLELHIPAELFRSIIIKLLEQNFYQPVITELEY